MKPVRIDSLLRLPYDGVVLQKEWTTKGSNPARSLLLEIAFFAGTVGPGLYIFSAAARFRPGMLASLIVVVLGYALPHAVFLGRMERSWRAMLRPGSSWISRGFLFANLFMLFAAMSVAHYVPGLNSGPLSPSSAAFEYIVIAGIISAVLLAMYPGFLFCVLKAIPFWNSMVLVPLFVIQALGGGAALTILLAIVPGTGDQPIGRFAAINALLVVITAGLIGLQLLAGWRSGPTGRMSVRILLRGPYRRLFGIGALITGLGLPLLGFAIVALAGGPTVLAAIASVMQLAGILLFKYCFLNAGAYRELFTQKLLWEGSDASG